MAPGDLGQDLLLAGSCLLSDLEGRGLAEVDKSGLEQEDGWIQAEDTCLQMVGSCWKLLEVNCYGLEGMAGMGGMLALMGHLDVVMGRLRAVGDRE